MSMYIEGRRAVVEALRSGVPGKVVLLADNIQEAGIINEIERLAAAAKVAVRRASKRQLDERSDRGVHQGVIFEVREHRAIPAQEFLERLAGRRDCLVLALDHITDPGNLGAIARSAEVLGVSALLLPQRRTAMVNAAAYKASAGALAWMPIVRGNLSQELERFKKEGFWVVGADAGAPDLAWNAPLEGRLVVVVGSEGEGLSRLVKERCDTMVSLPTSGKVDSLNVAQAATVIAYEWNRRIALRGK